MFEVEVLLSSACAMDGLSFAALQRGKSQLALDLLAQLTNFGVRFVFFDNFDMKGELEDDSNNPEQRKNRTQFLKQTGARYVRLIQEDLPINPLIRHQNPTENAQVGYEIANPICCFAPQVGAKQERNSSDYYQRLAGPDFPVDAAVYRLSI